MDKAREQHNVLMDKGSEQLTAFWVSCYSFNIGYNSKEDVPAPIGGVFLMP